MLKSFYFYFTLFHIFNAYPADFEKTQPPKKDFLHSSNDVRIRENLPVSPSKDMLCLIITIIKLLL